MTNGNYVVRSALWDSGTILDVGAVTWGNGTSGVSGVVSSSNSIVGQTANEGPIWAITTGSNLDAFVARNSQDGSGRVVLGSRARGFSLPSTPAGSLQAANGSVSLSVAGTNLQGTISSNANVTIAPSQTARQIDLGSKPSGKLGLSDTELDGIAAANLRIGSPTSGDLTISSPISRPTSTAMQLTSGGTILLDTGAQSTNGAINTAGGTLSLDAGTTIKPATQGVDANTSALSFAAGDTLQIDINGATVDSDYSQLSVVGPVTLTGVALSLNVNFPAMAGTETFTIVNATGGVTGQLFGLIQGGAISVGSFAYTVNYTANSVELVPATSGIAPAITQSPSNQTVVTGNTATFTATATGSPTPTVQWQVSTNGGSNWSDISNATNTTYSFMAASGDNGNQYRAVFTNAIGNVATNAATLTVQKAGQTITFGSLASVTYGHAAITLGATSSSSLPVSYSVVSGAGHISDGTLVITGAGSIVVQADQAGNTNYNAASSVLQTLTVSKADATVTVTPYSVTYDGTAHSATVTSITGVNGETGATVGVVTLTSTHTAAGTYASDSWRLTATANYNDIAATTISNSITKATATITVTPYAVIYDGNAHTATGTATGVGSANLNSGLTLSGTTHTSIGVYNNDAWSFHDVAGNYNDASGTINNLIGSAPVVTTQPANATVTAGVTATFTVVATGFPAPTIQWQVSTNGGSSWSMISGATAGTYSISTILSNQGSLYRAVLTNVLGVTTTNAATLTVNARPFSVLATYTTTAFTGLNTGSINLVDIFDSLGVTLPTTYTATINWGDGRTDYNVAVAHPNTDGTTVRVLGSHTYTTKGTYYPLITLVEPAGSTFITLSANMTKLIVGTDVSNKVSITRSSPIKNRTTGLWAQTVTINNNSGIDLTGNIDFLLIGLTAGVSLSGATGYTTGGANPYVRFSTNGLKAGKSISLVLKFVVPTQITSFNYTFETFTN